jgi:hypothetical protein
MKKTFTLAVLLLVLACSQKALAQKCGAPVPITSVYYAHETHTRFGFGVESGTQGIDSPFGLYAGVNFLKYTEDFQKSDSTAYDFKSNFYIKGTYRITGADGGGSIFLVAAPSMSMQTGLDMQTGIKAMLERERRFFSRTMIF